MNRNRQYIRAFLAVLVFLTVGCQKNEVFDTTETQTTQLRFSPTLSEAQTATRAGESNNNTLEIASAAGVKPPHIVIHTYTGTPGSSLNPYFSDELGYFATGNYWDVNSGKERFLPLGGMNLYGYFATDFADKGDLTNVSYSQPNSPTDYPKLTYTAPNDDALYQLDLIAAKVENINSSVVSIPFRHILSQINFGVKGLDRHQIMIKNIRLNNVYGKGTFDYQSWAWRVDNKTTQSYPYYFPDRTENGGGLGDKYRTQGGTDDSKNTYIFGDGGKFGPGKDDTFLYAQTDPTQTIYKTAANSDVLNNSFMLIPQEIKNNPNATVTFDYEITINGRTISSGVNQTVSLDVYYDWKPNLRYVYLFDFSDPSEKIVFDILIYEWENWDSDGTDTGIKNGTIQQPTPETLNKKTADNETIYLLGLLDRDEVWNWSDGSKYTFANLNTLTLDFSGVEMRGYTVEVKVPDGFTITGQNPSRGGQIVINRKTKILLEPTAKQINTRKGGDRFQLYGTLENSQEWDWSKIDFSSLQQNQSFDLDFTGVTFNSGNTISIKLPTGVIAAGAGVNGSNPYIINSAEKVQITNRRVREVAEPLKAILDVVAAGSEIGVNGGTLNSELTWNWSAYKFGNLHPQESFDILFSGITFNEQKINIVLPPGFRGFIGSGAKQNPLAVVDNDAITIKNNNINYPTNTFIENLSGENSVILAGEILTGAQPLDWSRYAFSNFLPQSSFTFDVSEVDFTQNLILKLPPFLALTGGTGVSRAGDTYTFTQPTSVAIKNNRVPIPSNQKINLMINGGTTAVDGGKLLENETCDWTGLQIASLTRGDSFSIDFKNIDFNGKYIEIKMPGLLISGTGVANPSFGVYRISTNTTITVQEQRWSITGGNPSFATGVAAGQRVILKGSVATRGQAWAWNQMPNLGSGEWFEIDYSQLYLEGSSPLSIPISGQTYSLSGDYGKTWAYLFWNDTKGTNGVVRFTKLWDVTGGNPSLTSVTAGTRVVLGGTVTGNQAWAWSNMPNLANGQWFEIDYSLLDLNGSNILSLPLDGATYFLSGDFEKTWAYLFWNNTKGTNGVARFTKQYSFPVIDSNTPLNSPNYNYTLATGTIYGPLEWWVWKWTDTTGYTINFNNITFVGTLTLVVDGYKGTAISGEENVSGSGTKTITISGPCIIKVTP